MSSVTDIFSFVAPQNLLQYSSESFNINETLDREMPAIAKQFDELLREEPKEQAKSNEHHEAIDQPAPSQLDTPPSVRSEENAHTASAAQQDKTPQETYTDGQRKTPIKIEKSSKNASKEKKQQESLSSEEVIAATTLNTIVEDHSNKAIAQVPTAALTPEITTKEKVRAKEQLPANRSGVALAAQHEHAEMKPSDLVIKDPEKGMEAPKHHALASEVKFVPQDQSSEGEALHNTPEKTPYYFEQNNTALDEKTLHVFMPKHTQAQATSASPTAQSLIQLRNLLSSDLNSVIVRNARIQLSSLRRGDIKLLLHPKELGQVHIVLAMQEKRVAGKIWVDNSDVKQIFESQLSELGQSFLEKGIDLQSLEVFIRNELQGQEDFEQAFANAEAGDLAKDNSAVESYSTYELDLADSTLVNIFV